MFNEKILDELEYMSTAVGTPVDYTQGGGGNTSVKLDDTLMAVKASGFKLKQITSREGYVVVNYKNIKEFHMNADMSSDRDMEKESSEFVQKNIVETEGLKTLRPSVEAGFHSILKKYVIHTHPVYANILCCAHKGREKVEEVFREKDYAIAWIPYIDPGFRLTLKIREKIAECMESRGKFPEVFFMENHGLIVTSDDSKKCVELHREINESIKAYLGIGTAYPAIELFRIDDNTFASKTEYLADYFRKNKVGAGFLDEIVLYPDQLVYLNGNTAVGNFDKKLNINTTTGEIIYKTGYSEARTIEEVLVAYVYVVNETRNRGFSVKTMSEKEIDFIGNWESEAYRKSLAGKEI